MVVKMNDRELRQFINSQADDSRKHDALYEANERIRQLEKQCASLAAEVDRQRPVVEAAVNYIGCDNDDTLRLAHRKAMLVAAVDIHQASKPK